MDTDRKAVLAGCFGNFIEIYDYSYYAYFSTLTANIFFPSEKYELALVYMFAIFAIERFIKPISGLFMGIFVDKHGRNKALYYSVAGMIVTSSFMSLLPTYNTIGIAAPLLLLTIRIMQGIFCSGEFITSIVYISENSSKKIKGLISSSAFISATLGIIASSLISLVIIKNLNHANLMNWGWRIPYLIGIPIYFLSYKIRKYLLKNSTPSPKNILTKDILKEVFYQNTKELIISGFITFLSGSLFFIFLIYLPTHLAHQKHIELSSIVIITITNLVVYSLFLPLFGLLSDKWGRKKIIFLASISILIFIYPIFDLINSSDLISARIAFIIYAILLAALNGALPALLNDIFPASSRVTSVAIGYGTVLAISGGISPLVCLFLIKITSNANAPSYYLMLVAFLSCIATWFLKPKSFQFK